MSQRLNDYFASEASEYLDQLERLLALPGKSDADQLLRLSTGVRGSAQMAGADTVARVAERLEDAARSIVSGNVAWSEELRDLSQQTVRDLKLLVRALNRWGQEEERRVREAILRWDDRDDQGTSVPSQEGVPVSSLFFDDAGPHVLEPGDAEPKVGTHDSDDRSATLVAPGSGDAHAAASAEDAARDPMRSEAVSVDQLFFRGDAALQEAIRLRPKVERAARDGTSGELDDLLTELFDLVELGLSSDASEG